MFENYLLDPDAITSVLSSIEGIPSVTTEAVSLWLTEHHADTKYRGDEVPGADGKWTVHAGKLLKDLFSQLSKQTAEYRKTEHSIALADWLLANKPELLREVADLIRDSTRPPS
jgi:hypothetical protein